MTMKTTEEPRKQDTTTSSIMQINDARKTTKSSDNSGPTRQHSCPYAVALQDTSDDESHISDHGSTSSWNNNNDVASSSLSTASLVEQCPAFRGGSVCPFSNAKSAEDVRQTLLQIPSSHFEKSGKFYKVLRGMHHVHETMMQQQRDGSSQQKQHPDTAAAGGGSSDEFHLPGGCPVLDLVGPERRHVTFTDAMEGYSLSAIMARMAREQMKQNDDGNNDDQEEDSEEFRPEEVVTGNKNSAIIEDVDETSAPLEPASAAETRTAKDGSAVPPDDSSSSLPAAAGGGVATLSYCLKTGTAESHQAAERVHFVANFIRGKIDRNLYGKLVVALAAVYRALEEALDAHAPEHFGTCHFPEQLRRVPALEDDMDFWHGADAERATRRTSPATEDYVNRIRRVGETNPLLLLAHSYTRYLGDLSGGKILARVAKRAMGLGDDGLAFYRFERVESAKRFKDTYRNALDGLRLSQREIDDVVREANLAFLLNVRIFQELDVEANVPGATVMPLEEATRIASSATAATAVAAVDGKGRPSTSSYSIGVSKEKKEKKPECPFAGLGGGGNGGAAFHKTKEGTSVVVSVTTTEKMAGKCPWPFILVHDFGAGLKDWKTWVLLGVVLSWICSKV